MSQSIIFNINIFSINRFNEWASRVIDGKCLLDGQNKWKNFKMKNSSKSTPSVN